MAQLSNNQFKRVVRFYGGVRVPAIAALLEPFGFTGAALDEGAAKLRAVGVFRKKAIAQSVESPSVYARCEEFQSLWFPIARATLTAFFPEQSPVFFEGLTQLKGAEAPLAVAKFATRVRELETNGTLYGENGAKARALLVDRGLTRAVLEQADALVEEWGDFSEPVVLTPAQTEELARAMEAAWKWYVHWSRIARTVLKRPRDRRALGLGRRRDDDAEAGATSAPALPAADAPDEPSDGEFAAE